MRFCCIDNDLYGRYADCADELEALKKYGEFRNGKLDATDEEKIALALDCDGVIFGSTYLSNDIIAKLDKLRVLQFLGTGINNYVDVDFCEKKGIKVQNVEEYGTNAVAEYALAMIFSAIRNIPKSNGRTKCGTWNYDGLEGMEISGSVVGILGTGKIGAKLIEKLSALGVRKILAFDIFKNKTLIDQYKVEYLPIEEVFSNSEIISVHLKYSSDTYQIISGDLINRMKHDAYLINTARAELVNYDALIDAVRSKRIRGAAVDVYYEEPIQNCSEWEDENIVATSHIGFFTKNAKRNLLHNAIKALIESIT